MSNIETNSLRYAMLDYKIKAWEITLDQLVRAGYWLERQRELIANILQAQLEQRAITPETLYQSGLTPCPDDAL